MFYFRKRNRRAHRVAYWAAKGDIPKGLVTDHLCCNPWCVNPDHLEVVTAWENTRRSGKSLPALNALKTACPKGHAYDRKYNGQRCCSICESEKRKRLRAKWKAEADSVAC